MSEAAFLAQADVSRETLERLRIYVGLLLRWTARINLIAPGTAGQVWTRHILDSAQLWPLRPDPCPDWIDLGSGGGLPGLVIAALAAETGATAVTLVESDARKAAFLSTAAREMDVPATVIRERAERLRLPPPAVVSARALAPLDRLLDLAAHLIGPHTICLFPKGARAHSELTAARARWHTRVNEIASATNATATILRLHSIERRHDTPD